MRHPNFKRFGAPPTSVGLMSRLAYVRAKTAGIDLKPLLIKAELTLHEIEDPRVRLRVRDQITFLNLVASALQDDLLGFHLALLPDLRAIGLLYCVLASSDILGEALQRGVRCSSIVNEGVYLKYIDDRDVGISFNYVGVSRHLDRHQIEF